MIKIEHLESIIKQVTERATNIACTSGGYNKDDVSNVYISGDIVEVEFFIEAGCGCCVDTPSVAVSLTELYKEDEKR